MLTAGLLISRVAGFIRDWFIASTFGATVQGDIAVILVASPDLIIGLIGNVGLLTYLTARFREETVRGANKMLRSYLAVFFALGGLTTIICCFLDGLIVSTLAPGLNSANSALAASLMRWVFVCLPFLSVGLVLSSWANAREHFGILGFCNLGFNVPVVLGLLLILCFDWKNTLPLVAAFVVCGVLCRLVIQAFSVFSKHEERPGDNLNQPSPGAVALVLACISGCVPLVVPLAGRAFASYSGEGGIVVFNLLFKVGELPMVVFGALFATVLLPKMVDRKALIPFQRLTADFGFLALLSSGIAAALLGVLHHQVLELVVSWMKAGDDFADAFAAGVPLFLMLLPKTVVIFASTVLFARRKYAALAITTLAFLGLLFSLLVVDYHSGSGVKGIYWSMFYSYLAYSVALVGCVIGFRFVAIRSLARRGAIMGGAALILWLGLGFVQGSDLGEIGVLGTGGILGGVLLWAGMISDRFWGRVIRRASGPLKQKLAPGS